MHHAKPYCFNHDLFNVSLLIMFINYTKPQNTIFKLQCQNSQDILNQIRETTMSRACHYGPMYPKIHPTEVDSPSLIVKNMNRHHHHHDHHHLPGKNNGNLEGNELKIRT